MLWGLREDLRRREDQADAVGVGLVGVGKRMSSVEDEPRSIERREVDGCGVTLHEVQSSHRRLRKTAARGHR